MGYDSINLAVLAQMPPRINRLLDVGCGEGSMGGLIGQKYNCNVVGLTFDFAEAQLARGRLTEVFVQDLNQFDPGPLGKFDCVLCSHVLEHLYRPDLFLQKLRETMAEEATLVIALPNILFWRQRFKLMRGQFRYTSGGLMDRTHYRFFDWVTCRELVANAGYRIEYSAADGLFPLSRLLGKSCSLAVNRLALRTFPSFFGWQFIIKARAPKSSTA